MWIKIVKSCILFFLFFIHQVAFGRFSLPPHDEDEMKLKIDSIFYQDSLNRLYQAKKDLQKATEFLNYLGFDSAITYAEKITRFDVNLLPAEIVTEAYYIIGKSNRVLGNNDLALQNYWTTIQKLRYVEGFGCRSEVNQELGHMYYQLGLTQKAIEKFEDAYRIERERNDLYKQIELLRIIAALYKETGNLAGTILYQNKLLRLYNAHNEQKAFQLMKEMSDVYVELDSFQTAVNLQVQILLYEKRQENLTGQFQALLEQLKIFYAIPDFDQFYNRGIQQFNVLYNRQNKKTLTPEIQEIKAYELLYYGHFYRYWGNLNPPDDLFNAIQYYDSAVQIFDRIGLTYQAAYAKLDLAETYFKLENYRSCIDYCESAVIHLVSLREYKALLTAYDLLARSYEELDRYKHAYHAKEQYIAYKDSIRDLQLIKLKNDLNDNEINSEKIVLNNFEQFLQQELDTLNESLLRLDIINYKRKNELLITEASLNNAIIDNQTLKQQQDSQAIELYRQKLAFERNANEISMLQAEMKKRELELKNKQQEQALKEQQIKVLEKEKKLNAAELQKSEAQRIVLILSISISLIILTFVVSGYYNIKKSKEKIASKNKVIEINNQKLKELNEEKNRLIRIVAHDLKNPLTSALSLAEMLKSKLQLITPEEKHSLSLIRRSLRRMHEMISKILDIKAIDAEKLNIEFEAVNVQQVMNYLVEMFRLRADQKNIRVLSSIEEVYAMVDRNYFIQIMENLLSNALKFSGKGTTIYIKAIDEADKCRIMIRDEGPGIRNIELNDLFKENKSLSAQPTGGESSNGLGLSIVKKFVDTMGGRVWCESKLNSGSTFIVEFDKAFVTV
jgi:signal transduction histidine kinase/tetratricopeptide (TPR) repeat protein